MFVLFVVDSDLNKAVGYEYYFRAVFVVEVDLSPCLKCLFLHKEMDVFVERIRKWFAIWEYEVIDLFEKDNLELYPFV